MRSTAKKNHDPGEPSDGGELNSTPLPSIGKNKALLRLLRLEDPSTPDSILQSNKDPYEIRVARLMVSLADRAERKGLKDERIGGDKIDNQRLEKSILGASSRITALISVKEKLPPQLRSELIQELLELGAARRTLESCKHIAEAQFGMRPSAMQVFGALALSRDLPHGIDSPQARISLRQMVQLYRSSEQKDLFWVGDPTPYHLAVNFGPDGKSIFKEMAGILERNGWYPPTVIKLCEQMGLPRNDLTKQIIRETLGIFQFFRLVR